MPVAWWQRVLGGGRSEAPGGRAGPVSAGITVLHEAGVPLAGLVSLGVTRSGLEVFGLPASAQDLVPVWHQLRALHERSGLWPVLLGPDVGDMCMGLPEAMDDYDDAAVLGVATAMTDADLAELRAHWLAQSASDTDGPEFGELPRQVRATPAHFEVAEQDGLVALVPAVAGWQVPAILGWSGGVNYEMEPAEHAANLRDWSDRFGAELVSLTGGDQVLELLVTRPPREPAEALAAAWEQYAYCSDSVDQGVGSVTALAETQTGSHSWHFWWD